MEPQSVSSAHTEPPKLVRGYTLAMGVFAAVLAFVAVIMYSLAENPSISLQSQWTYVLRARVCAATALLTGLVVYLRARESRFATGATAVFNVLLVLLALYLIVAVVMVLEYQRLFGP